MSHNPTIVFVCEHGAAKSVVAATYFNQLAKDAGLDLQAIARGTNPDDKLSEQAVQGLAKDGLTSVQSTPQLLSISDVRSAIRIVSFCELPTQYGEMTVIEQWTDIPPVSQEYDKSRDVILEHLRDLLNRIRSSA